MFVGEAPGADEDLSGRPFVGKSGRLLRNLILDSGHDPLSAYITNTVKCRPPQNRVPAADETEACAGFLEAQLGFLRPRVLVCVGATAVRRILGECGGITAIRGRWFFHPTLPETQVLPIFHPSYLLRNLSNKPGGIVDLTRRDIEAAFRVAG